MKSKSKSALATGPSGLVYSTDSGRMCPACRQPITDCMCSKAPAPLPSNGVVRVSLDTQGRAGKGVTVVRGLALDLAALTALGKQLKAAFGSGGTVKDGMIEVQGDHCERVMVALKSRGFGVKRSRG